ncbi:HD domain-containing protein [Sinosporangium album]|uniref:HD domain-containing protein n=1 Tax=Sinosporangium album TaxID=504805 RepID=A0A1G8HAJ0_9ACTN|nr:HD-GYP domain-containing protein [Sinosporangium album]SDI03688.1 HD domain-containing protein [Sinosporangium album]
MRGLPWPAKVYLIIVIGAAFALIGHDLVAPGQQDAFAQWDTLMVLALLFLLCESLPTLLNIDQVAVSMSFSAALAAVVLVGPEGAAVVGMTAVLSVRPGLALVKRLFNGAQFAICSYSAGQVFVWLGGRSGVPGVDGFEGLILPFAGAAAVFVPLNFLLTATMLWLADGLRADQIPISGMAQFLVSYLGYATFGLLIAGLWATVETISVVLVLLPLFVARWGFGQYHAQQRSYDATIAALCQAVETKDYYTRGHCTRVSLASTMIAQEIGMRSERLRAIRYAGMLHDVGKLGVPTKVLQKEGKLTEEEFAAIQLHPMRGLEIVRGIDFLDEAFAGIMHHHERHDGKGYPMGLAADEIPEFARVIAVADAFDSMTSDRSYRKAKPIETALAELRKGAGTQFDPLMVSAFIKVIDRDGWDPPRTAPADPVERSETVSKDHDDPTTPIQVVSER